MGRFDTLNLSDQELLEDCTVQTSRGSGPGGTKADTTESVVMVEHDPTGISVRAQDHRSQSANRKTALRRLRLQYAVQVRDRIDPERMTVPDQLASYLNDGIKINRKNPHFPFWVKLVLDVFESCGGRLGETANAFGVSTNQLVNFLDRDKAVWKKANQIREQYGHGPLKR